MASLVPLVVTDIVGSTRLWAEHETEMPADPTVHDGLLRAVAGLLAAPW